MGNITKRNKYYIDKQLEIKCRLSDHSHGYTYVYFPNNIHPFEPDLILDNRYVNIKGRFYEVDEATWNEFNNRMDHVTVCKNCGHHIT